MIDYLEETPVLAGRGYFGDKVLGGAREGDREIYGWDLISELEWWELGAVVDGLDEGRIHDQGVFHG